MDKSCASGTWGTGCLTGRAIQFELPAAAEDHRRRWRLQKVAVGSQFAGALPVDLLRRRRKHRNRRFQLPITPDPGKHIESVATRHLKVEEDHVGQRILRSICKLASARDVVYRLIAIVDHNTLQITGRTRDVCCNEPLDEKFKAFGWEVRIVDGHSHAQLTDALSRRPGAGKPLVVIANTSKGKGVSFMEDVAKWHHGVPGDAEYDAAIRELDEALARAEGSTR